MAFKVIDLDIDSSLSAITRVEEVGFVLQPAIETELMYFTTLPEYVNYATGDTKDDMLLESIAFVKRRPYERKDMYIQRCTEYLVKNEGKPRDQAYAICISTSEEFVRGEKVSFDYDDTLSTVRGYGLALHEKYQGSTLYIISARNDKKPMLAKADKLGIPHDRVFATGSNKAKIQKIKELRIDRHYDNNKDVIKSLGNLGTQFSCPCLDEFIAKGVEMERMSEEFNLIGFIDGEPIFSSPMEAEMYGENQHGCTGHHSHTDENGNEVYMACEMHPEAMESEFSISDYPQYITDNAIKAKNWVDKNGYGDCMTPVGKARLNQLANREPISLETLKRMKAYADRHKKDLEASKSFDDGCGMLAWYSWGLDETGRVEKWLESEISREEMSIMGEITCENCGWKWNISDGGNDPYICHECGYDNQPNMTSQFSLDDYSEEELESVKMLKFLMETDYEKFEAVIGAMRGATESEIKKRNHKTPTTYFRYERILSGSPDRDFCTSIEGRYFRRLEIDLLRDTNTEFGHQKSPYSKWLYKGGPNCVHAWKKFLVQGNDIADLGMADGKAGIAPKSMPNNGYYSEETKRKSEVAYIISQQNMSKHIFKSDTEQRMLFSPLMVPNVLIPRVENGEKYFVRFKPEVIEKIQRKFMIEKRLNSTNYEHSDYKFNDLVMVESWIITGPKDKAYQLGFTEKQAPIGSWMGGYKILDTEEGDIIWNDYIKSGKVKGLSVEGEFLLKFSSQDFSREENLLRRINDILKEIE